MMATKKTIKKTALETVAVVSKKTSEVLANIPCIWWNYEPKKPQAVKKLRKFK